MKEKVISYFLLALLLPAGTGLPQDKGDKQQKDDFQKKVDVAIDRGAEFLVKKLKELEDGIYGGTSKIYGSELIALYALVHANRENDKEAVALAVARKVEKAKNPNTYLYAVLAMTLAMHDKEKYKVRAEEIAVAFVRGMNKIGGYGYELYDSKASGYGYDNLSTSQFAVFGLHACWRYLSADDKGRTTTEADVKQISKSVWEKIARYWLDGQQNDGGWSYLHPILMRDRSNDPYNTPEFTTSYHSMTCAGISSLAIVRLHVGKSTQQKIDKALQKGKKWLESNFTINKCSLKNCSACRKTPYYFLYSLEKACDLAGWEKIGEHDWYREGAEYLLKQQKGDGSWEGNKEGLGLEDTYIATSFAILFLKRASRRLLPTDTPGSWATGKPPTDTDTVEKDKDVETKETKK